MGCVIWWCGLWANVMFDVSHMWDLHNLCIRFLILFEIILSEVSLLQNKCYFFSNDKLSLPTGQLH